MDSLYTQILHPDGLCLIKGYIAFRNFHINYVRLKQNKTKRYISVLIRMLIVCRYFIFLILTHYKKISF